MITKVIDTVQKFFCETLDKPGKIIGVLRENGFWKVKIEVAEEVEYMRKRAHDDLMAIYEVLVDQNLELFSFDRIALRERDSLTCVPVEIDEDEN